MYDLGTFGLTDMIDAGRRLRLLDGQHRCMEEAAVAVVDFLFDSLQTSKGSEARPGCVLARCFMTSAYADLPADLQFKARETLRGRAPEHAMQCLTLLASRGESPAWNSRHTSAAHQAIPLPTVEIVSRAPMISQLVLQLGMKIEHLVDPLSANGDAAPTFNVFHVEHAAGSKMVPDQETFVARYGVEAVLGFGGLLPAGELFAVILFTRVRLSPETAALFRTLALGVKLTLLPFSGKPVFAEC